MAISKRLKAIAKYTDGFTSLADIACDHGYLGIYAVENYGLKNVLLTDINPMPLASAVSNTKKKNLQDIISCKLGDGLAPLDKDYEVITISGIGGILLKDIMSKDIVKCQNAKRMVLCPNTDLYEVRKFLHENNFEITHEEIIYDYKYYEIIVCSYVGKKIDYTEIELKYGPKLLINQTIVFKNYYHELLKLYQRQVLFINDNEAREKITNKINEINSILNNNL